MKKQLGILLLALAVAIGFSGAAAAQNYGYAAQTATGNQYTGYANSGMTYSGMNPLTYLIGSYVVKLVYLIHMVLMGGYMPGGIMGNMPMSGTGTGGTVTGNEGTATGTEGTATGTEGTATGTESGATEGAATGTE